MDDWLARALLAGFGVAFVAGPLGVFVVWRRMAYFGDTLAHASLLGVALGVLLGAGADLGVIAVCAAVAAALSVMERRKLLTNDVLLGVLSHGALALGVIALAMTPYPRAGMMNYLFGDILAVTGQDIAWIYGAGMASLAVLCFLWRSLLAAVVHEEMAAVEGVPVAAVRLAFLALLAVLVALSMKVVGVLLVTALLVIPAAAARAFARSPEQMALLAAAIGCIAVAFGMFLSFALDAPSGPSIVAAALLLFVFSLMFRAR